LTQSAVLKPSELKIIAQLAEKSKRWTELKKETKLSSRGLSKALDALETSEKITRVVDVASGGYPPPVYYELNRKLVKEDFVDMLLENKRFSENLIRDAEWFKTQMRRLRGKIPNYERSLLSLCKEVYSLMKDKCFEIPLSAFLEGRKDHYQYLKEQAKETMSFITETLFDVFTEDKEVAKEALESFEDKAYTGKEFDEWFASVVQMKIAVNVARIYDVNLDEYEKRVFEIIKEKGPISHKEIIEETKLDEALLPWTLFTLILRNKIGSDEDRVYAKSAQPRKQAKEAQEHRGKNKV